MQLCSITRVYCLNLPPVHCLRRTISFVQPNLVIIIYNCVQQNAPSVPRNTKRLLLTRAHSVVRVGYGRFPFALISFYSSQKIRADRARNVLLSQVDNTTRQIFVQFQSFHPTNFQRLRQFFDARNQLYNSQAYFILLIRFNYSKLFRLWAPNRHTLRQVTRETGWCHEIFSYVHDPFAKQHSICTVQILAPDCRLKSFIQSNTTKRRRLRPLLVESILTSCRAQYRGQKLTLAFRKIGRAHV